MTLATLDSAYIDSFQNDRTNIMIRRNTTLSLLLSVTFILLAPSVFVGCASIAGYKQFYPGLAKTLREVAILSQRDPYSRSIMTFSVDGRPALFNSVLELQKGPHTIATRFALPAGSNQIVRSERMAEISFLAQAGHVYVIASVLNRQENTWRPAIWDITSELNNPNHKQLIDKIDHILKSKSSRASSQSIRTMASNKPQRNDRAYFSFEVGGDVTYLTTEQEEKRMEVLLDQMKKSDSR